MTLFGKTNRIDASAIGKNFFSALFIGSMEIVFAISFAALIYSGELSSRIPQAISYIILGDAFLCIVVALLSTNPNAIGVEQDAPGVMLGVISAGIIAANSGLIDVQFATVAMLLVLSTVLTGVLLILLGIFKLGGFARFLPYPVVGGFLGGTGWLLVQGGIEMLTETPIGVNWLNADKLGLWIPALALAGIVYHVSSNLKKPYATPFILLAACIPFYIIVWLTGTEIGELHATGWLFDTTLSSSKLSLPLTAEIFAKTDWTLLLQQLPSLIPVAIISIMGLLLNSSGAELILKKDLDLNRELIAAGAGNIAAGMAGGLVGFQDISFTTINHRINKGNRIVGVFVGLIFITFAVFGISSILYIPKFVFASVLIYLGISLLKEWVYETFYKFSRSDFLAVLIIMVVLIASGLLEGLVAGLLFTASMFVVNYSRVSVIKFAFNGRDYRSRVTRALPEQNILDGHGESLYMMKLEGYIFFGTANGIFDEIKKQIRLEPRIRYCIMDFSKVSGIDSTGALSFKRMTQWSKEQGIRLSFSGLDGASLDLFKQEVVDTPGEILENTFFSSLDHAIEWHEDLIISENISELNITHDLAGQLRFILKDKNADKLIPFLRQHIYKAGEYLIKEGDMPDYVHLILSGKITALLERDGKKPVRLETMSAGRTVGEVGFYLGTTRTASVIADMDSVVYSLSREELARMEREEPEAANIFHRLNALLLSERVSHATKVIRALENS